MLLGLGSAQEQAHATLASLEINSHIQKATQEELAAYVAFVAGGSMPFKTSVLRWLFYHHEPPTAIT